VLQAGHNSPKPHAWEDVGVVALARNVQLAIDRDWIEGTPTGKEHLALGPGECFLCRALSLGRRVGQREDYWPVVEFAHFFHHSFVEHLSDCAHTNDGSRL